MNQYNKKESFTKEIICGDEENEGVELYCRISDFDGCDVGCSLWNE